jgi:DNA-binding transcriptional regulator YhcF (GntR family)
MESFQIVSQIAFDVWRKLLKSGQGHLVERNPMANDTKLTWAKSHSFWLDHTNFLYTSLNARYLWFTLNIIARESSAGGALLVGDKPISIGDIAHRINMKPEDVESSLKELEKIGWVTREEKTVFIVDYIREQVLSGDELAAEKTRDYRRMRQRKKRDNIKNRDRVVKSNATVVVRALGDLGFLDTNSIKQIINVTNKKTANKAINGFRKVLENNDEKNSQDFLTVCYDLGYIPLDDGFAFDQIWEMIETTDTTQERTGTPTREKSGEGVDIPHDHDANGIETVWDINEGWNPDNEIHQKFVTLRTSLVHKALSENMEKIKLLFPNQDSEVKTWVENYDHEKNSLEFFFDVIKEKGFELAETKNALKQILIFGDWCVHQTSVYKFWDDFKELGKKHGIRI